MFKKMKRPVAMLMTMVMLAGMLLVPTFAWDGTYTYSGNKDIEGSRIKYGPSEEKLSRESTYLFTVTGDNADIKAYCIDPNNNINTGHNYTADALPENAVGNKLRAIILNGYPNVTLETLQAAAGVPSQVLVHRSEPDPLWYDWDHTREWDEWVPHALSQKDAITAMQAAVWSTMPGGLVQNLSTDANLVFQYLLGRTALGAPAATANAQVDRVQQMGVTANQLTLDVQFSATAADVALAMDMTDMTGLPAGTGVSGAGNSRTIMLPVTAGMNPFSFTVLAKGAQNVKDVALLLNNDKHQNRPATQNLVMGKAYASFPKTIASATRTIDIYRVVVRHVDANGNKLAEPDYQYGLSGTNYVTNAKASLDAKYTHATPLNATGTFSVGDSGTITVTYQYTKKNGTITVNHEDKAGVKVAEPQTTTGPVDEKVIFSPYTDLPAYVPAASQGPVDLTFKLTKTTHTFKYDRRPAGSLMVRYMEMNKGVEVKELGKTGNLAVGKYVGDTVDIEIRSFMGYKANVTSMPDEVLTSGDKTIVVEYTKLPVGSITVKHVAPAAGGDWKDIATTQTIPAGEFGTTFMTDGPLTNLTGYTFVNCTAPSSFDKGTNKGVFGEDAQEIRYEYAPKMGGSIQVNYWLAGTTTEIKPSITVEAQPFDTAYDVSAKFINLTDEGYEHDSTIGALTGKHTMDTQVVTFYYKPIMATITTLHVFGEGDAATELAKNEQTQRVTTDYTTAPKTDFVEYDWDNVTPENASGKVTERHDRCLPLH